MKNTILDILTVIAYIIVWGILVLIAILSNLSVTGRLEGGITATGGLAAFWIAYKIVKWLRAKYTNKPF